MPACGRRRSSSTAASRPKEIVSAAEHAKTDILVLGTHGRTGVMKVLLGSVASRVVATASCPVLTVRMPDETKTMNLASLVHNWWMMAVRGVLAIAFGVSIVVWPHVTLSIVVLLFGVYAIVDGVWTIGAGTRASTRVLRCVAGAAGGRRERGARPAGSGLALRAATVRLRPGRLGADHRGAGARGRRSVSLARGPATGCWGRPASRRCSSPSSFSCSRMPTTLSSCG